MEWRQHIAKDIQPFVEKLISESFKDESLKKSKHPSKTQLWIALGLLAKQAYNLEIKTRYLEQALREISPKAKTRETLKTEAEVEKFLSDIAKGKILKKEKKKKSEVRTNF